MRERSARLTAGGGGADGAWPDPIGIPAFFWALLWRNRFALHTDSVKARFGFLYAGYRAEVWWFEMVDAIHKVRVIQYPRPARAAP